MTTPRPYLWQSLQLRASDVDGTGGIAHYFTEEAQSFYLKSGMQEIDLEVEDGHWQDLTPGTELEVAEDEYSQLSWHHPSFGTLYGTAILPGEGNETILYLLRYEYAKDCGHLVQTAKYSMQVDNPITQLNADIKNFESEAFTKPTSLFVPGAMMELGLTMGDSRVYKLGILYIDQVDFTYNKATVGISGRNQVGVVLNDESINTKDKKTDTIHNLCEWVLGLCGIDDALIEENSTEMTIEYSASDSPMQILTAIADKASGFGDGEDWGMEETADGQIVIGYNAFRGTYCPKSVYKFNGRSTLFKRASQKAIDGAYSKVYVTGKDRNNHDLEPVIASVETWQYWKVGTNKTYFPQTLENTTQAELENYAQVLVKQLKKSGLHESYTTTIRPQLLVGDYATVQENGESTDIGIITQITHTMGEKGYSTDFVADSGGDKKDILTRSADDKVYTSNRRNNGDNRKKRIMDFIKGTAQSVVRASGGGGGGGGGSTGVQDVEVNGTSVVLDNVAHVTVPTKTSQLTNDSNFVADASYVHTDNNYTTADKTKVSNASVVEASQTNGNIVVNGSEMQVYDDSGKQDTLTAGDRITISSDTISADIAPFSIADGKMCMTYKGEVE